MKEIKALQRHIKTLESSIAKEPVILLKADGEHVLSDKAEAFISEEGINKDGLLALLKSEGDKCRTFYENVEALMMRLPHKSDDVLVLLKKKTCASGYEECNLTLKEKDILKLLAKGMTNKEIAASLGISPGTVNTHLDSVYRKLGVSNRLSAVFKAMKNGFVVPTAC